jgi:hypothetical protein
MERRALLALLAAVAALPGLARAEEKKRAGGVNYIPINTLTGTTNRPGGRRGVLTVDCGLDVPDEKLRAHTYLSLPRLRAAYVQVVQTYAAGLPSGSPPNTDIIGRELQRQTDQVLGRRGARLLLGAILVN